MSTAERYADMICANGPLGVRSAKESMIRSLGRALEDALRFENILFSTLTRTEDFCRGAQGICRKTASGVERQVTADEWSTPSP